MKHFRIILITALSIVWPSVARAETAAEVLDRVLKTLDDAQGWSADFTITADDGSSSGELLLSGDRFAIKGEGASIWYDGKTQWSYSEATSEVNITEPTADELAEVNPLVILKSDPDTYQLKIKKKNKSTILLQLTDKTDAMSISRASVMIDPSTYLPQAAEVETSSGERMTLVLKNLKKLKSAAAALFRFNPATLPGVEIIDLR